MSAYGKNNYRSKEPEKGFREFTADLKNGEIPEVLFMYGKEDYLMRWAVNLIIEKYTDPATRAMDAVTIDWSEGMESEVISACETFSMLSSKRVVWVRDKDLSKKKEENELLEYVEDPAFDTILIFTSQEAATTNGLVKALRKAKAFYCFDTLGDKELRSFAAKRFREAGVEITNRQLYMLIDATGYRNKESDYRLYNFENDILKIIAHSQGGVISDDDISDTVSGDEDTFIFDLLDGISGNNKNKAFEILHNRISRDPYEITKIMAQIISQMELMYMIKEIQEDPDEPFDPKGISARAGVHEFRGDKARKYAAAYSMEDIRRILLRSYETYGDILTGAVPPEIAIELFVGEI